MLAVASSNTRIFFCDNMARAKHSSCFSPALKLEPWSATLLSNWPSSFSVVSFMPTFRNTFSVSIAASEAAYDTCTRTVCITCSMTDHRLKSECSLKGSMLERIVPLKSVGSCGDHRNAASDVMKTKRCHVDVIDVNASGWLSKLQQGLNEGRLARPSATNNANLQLLGCCVKIRPKFLRSLR